MIGSPEAEASVLGCLLLGATDAVLEVEDFASPQHRAVHSAIIALHTRNEPVDAVTVVGELRRSGLESALTCDTSAGRFVADLLSAPPSVGSVGHYRRIALEHRLRRAAHEAGERLQQIAEQGSGDELGALLVEAFDEVRRLANRLQVATP